MPQIQLGDGSPNETGLRGDGGHPQQRDETGNELNLICCWFTLHNFVLFDNYFNIFLIRSDQIQDVRKNVSYVVSFLIMTHFPLLRFTSRKPDGSFTGC